MSDPDSISSIADPQATAREKRQPRILKTGSTTNMAEWLLGLVGRPDDPDFGALAGSVFAAGALWRCGPDCIWRPWREDQTYRLAAEFDGAEYTTPEGKLRAVQMSAEKARSIHRIFESQQARPDFFTKAPQGLAFRNGFLRIAPDGGCRLEELTPDCRVTRQLPFDYVAVPAPESFACWRAFLQSVWGSGAGPDGKSPDVESINLVHQMIGYLLSGSNDQQKLFLLLGPPRSGKGTIAKLLFKLFGPDATGFKLAGLDGNFALETLLGRALAVDGDVRRSKSANRDEGKIVERVLGITSGDVQEIPRKNKTAVTCILPTRIVLNSNPPFSLRDVGGAMASRIVTLPFRNSFLGAEDFSLEDKLTAELPAIVALAMQSMKSFRAAGRFIEPQSAAEMREEIERGQNPLKEFFDEWCVFEPGAQTLCQDLYQEMRDWALVNGNAAPSAQSFGSALKQLGVGKTRHREDGKRGARAYVGVALRAVAEDGKPSEHRLRPRLKAPASGVASITPIRKAP
jgi:P4 family phage/plasmid primase-like protien